MMWQNIGDLNMTIASTVISVFLIFNCLHFNIENYSLNKMLEKSMQVNYEYRQKLIKFKNIIRNNNVFPCEGSWVDCENCKDEITDNGKTCMIKGLKEIRSLVERI